MGLRKLEVGRDDQDGERHGENCECDGRDVEDTFQYVQRSVTVDGNVHKYRDARAAVYDRSHLGLRGMPDRRLG